MDDALFSSGKLLADCLNYHEYRIVFAESCTAGLVSATLARIPGVSQWHCGSAVTYRNLTKHQWLGVALDQLEPPGPGPVSQAVAIAMAEGVLSRTPEARISAAVTGHLGPDAETGLDGVVWIAIAGRDPTAADNLRVLSCERLELDSTAEPGFTLRETRQRRATVRVLELTEAVIELSASAR